MIRDIRERITEGVNPTRLRLELKRSLSSIPTVVMGVVATLVGGVLIFSQLTPTLFKSTHEVQFAIDDAYGVLEGVDEVRYRGVPAGTIKRIEREGTRLVLRVSLRDDYPVYRDVRSQLRPETPLNDMYLDIADPGTPARGEISGVVPEAQTETSIKINDVLNTLRAPVRTRLAQLLDNLGNGLADRGAALRAAVVEFTPFIANAEVIARELATRERLTRRLVRNAGQLTTALGEREEQVRTLVEQGSATLGTLQEGSRDLDLTLQQLPPTVNAVNTSFAAVRSVLGDVDRAVADLGPAADRLPAALATVRELNTALGPAVDRLRQPVRRLVPLAAALRPVADDADATAQALYPRLRSIDKITDSVTRCEDAIIHFFQWNASLSKFGDIRGPIPRGNLAVNAPDSGGPGLARRNPAENCAGGTTTRDVPDEEDLG